MAKTSPKKTARKKAALPAKPAVAPAPMQAAAQIKRPRRLKKPQYKSFRRHKHIKSEGNTVPSAFRLFRTSVGMLERNWKVFVAISLIYGVLNFVLVQGFTVQNLSDTKETLSAAAQGGWGWLLSSVSLFAFLLGNADSSNANPGGSVYQVAIQLVVSLAVIWALRQAYAGNKIRIRDSFYQGTYPLVPFVLVLLTMLVQAIPGAIGVYLYTLVNNTNIAVTTPEQILWALVAFLAILLSLYMICSSIVALYVVSLPNMEPMAAIRSANQLVQFRRWAVLRKVLFLPITLLIIGALILLPVILIFTPAAPWVFLVLSMFVLPVAHSYLYTLYRSLL